MSDFKVDPEYAEFLEWKRHRSVAKKEGKSVRRKTVVKEHRSGFHVTINSNQVGAHDRWRPKLETAVQAVLDDIAPYILHVDGSGDRYPKYLFNEQKNGLVDDVEASINFELGPRGQLHCHVPIEIHHRSNIRLDPAKIKKSIDQATGLPGCYVNIRGIPIRGEWGKILAYAKKDQPTQ